jgi:hypothetical protein
MKLTFFGNSYDIVKKSLIGWLGEFGDWSAHPMFTERVTLAEATAYSRFLGTSLLSAETITPETDRGEYFSSCRTAGNLFLDPDTGIRLVPRGGSTAVNYVFGSELLELSHARPGALTLVFDKSYSRGRQAPDPQEKLRFFASHWVHGFAYSSHAAFLLLSCDAKLIEQARKRLVEISGLPASRLVALNQ